MKLFLLSLLSLGTLSFGSPALAKICEPTTRCTDFKRCYINNVEQPCAYASNGARSGDIVFRHGFFRFSFLDPVAKRRVQVTYGKNREFRTFGTWSTSNGYHVIRLDDGVVVRFPSSGGVYAGD
ncbi:hypothetical protein [Synechococcus elongatus]|uniref:Uncharacterized protein n=1 Tax=Synechococcus elongatus PCC 11802 TaxID=2283154 RepID=A0AAT9JN06_SYNEL|nr:hypothetical protein [Synechococcus elongatus]QFZ92472.1 hypothetical protein EKO22_09045 [Synechococcus elongatus PCC 11802]